MPTQQILTFDNTSISNYKACPRQYLLKRYFNWTAVGKKPAMDFGGAFHEGMAAILRNKECQNKASLYQAAVDAFNAEWVDRGMPLEDSELFNEIFPRIPTVAYEMYKNWLEQHWQFLMSIEVLEVEEPFAVPIFSKHQCPYCLSKATTEHQWINEINCPTCNQPLTEVYLVGRRDAVYKKDGLIWCLEHKTSSLYKKDGGFQTAFINGFKIDSQVDGYAYTTRMTHGDAAQGVMVAAFSTNKYAKSKVFNMYPQVRTEESLFTYIREVSHWITRLINDLIKGPEIFHRNSMACQTRYGFCDMYDLCRFEYDPWSLEAPPIGYKVDPWEPFDQKELEALLLKEAKNG